MPQLSDKTEEYTQLNEAIRHYHNQRFAQLTLWLAITGGLFSVLFGQSYKASLIGTLALKLIGIIASVAFWLMDQRMVDHWRYFWKRLQDIEPELGFRMWLDRPKRKWLGSTVATN